MANQNAHIENLPFAQMEDVAANSIMGTTTAGKVAAISCTAAGRAVLDDADAAAQRTTLGLSQVAEWIAVHTYSASNVTTDRTFNADSTTIDEIADALGTLIADLRTAGIVN